MASIAPRSRLRARLLPGLLLALVSTTPLHGQTSLTLGWDENANLGVAGYKVYYGTASRQYTNSVQTGDQFSCTITGLVDNTTYCFAVTAVDSNKNESSYSDELRYPPDVPVQARIYPDGATLTWDETVAANVIGFNVYYGTTSGDYTNSVQTGLGFVNTTPGFVCTLTGLAQGTTYYFALKSYDITGEESDFLQEQIYTTMVFAPTAEVVARIMPENYLLFWYVMPATNVIGYDIYYGASSGDYTNNIKTGPGLIATITNLIEGTTYYFAIAPYYDNAGDEGALSVEQSYTPGLDLTAQGIGLPDGTEAFGITGPAGKTYEVFGSPDGLKWTVLGAGTIGPDGTLELLEPPGTLDMYQNNYVLSEVDTSNLNPILQLSLTAGGSVLLSATGQVDHAYAVLATCDLATPAWTSLATIYPDSTGSMSFTDPAPTNRPARFYRLQDVAYAAPPPRLQIAQSPDGSMLLTGTGRPNHTYNVLATPGTALATQPFTDWELIQSITSDATGAFEVPNVETDGLPFRFYRAVEVPAGLSFD